MADVVVWAYKNNKNLWSAYEPNVSCELERLFSMGTQQNVNLGIISSNLSSYEVNFVNMTQTTISSGSVREIRRNICDPASAFGQGVVWEFEGDHPNQWTTYDMETMDVIEEGYAKRSQLNSLVLDLQQSRLCLPYILDFKTMTQMRVETGRMRRIQRRLMNQAFPPALPQTFGASSSASSSSSALMFPGSLGQTTNWQPQQNVLKIQPGKGKTRHQPYTQNKSGAASAVNGVLHAPQQMLQQLQQRLSQQTFQQLQQQPSQVQQQMLQQLQQQPSQVQQQMLQQLQQQPSQVQQQAFQQLQQQSQGSQQTFLQLHQQRAQMLQQTLQQQPSQVPQQQFQQLQQQPSQVPQQSNQQLQQQPAKVPQQSNQQLQQQPSQVSQQSNQQLQQQPPSQIPQQTFQQLQQQPSQGPQQTFQQLQLQPSSQISHQALQQLQQQQPSQNPGPLTRNQLQQSVGSMSSAPTLHQQSQIQHQAMQQMYHSSQQQFYHQALQNLHMTGSYQPMFGHIPGLPPGFQYSPMSLQQPYSATPMNVVPPPLAHQQTSRSSATSSSMSVSNSQVSESLPSVSKVTIGKSKKTKSKTGHKVLDSYMRSINTDLDKNDCSICFDKLSEASSYGEGHADAHEAVELNKCGHQFHKLCLLEMYNSIHKDSSLQCPSCKTIYGEKTGTCPPGYMQWRTAHDIPLPGYEGYGTIIVSYHISPGVQGPEHPRPGQRFSARGFPRYGYLPDCDKGRKVLKLLMEAFKRRLMFTIATSHTTGEDNTVTWNEIHHKTEPHGNSSGHGYPDPQYLDNALMELAAHGVTEDSLR